MSTGWSAFGAFAWDVIRQLLSVGLAAWLAVAFVNRSKSRADFIERRVDDVCSEVRQVADLASEYWVKPPFEHQRVSESRITARFNQIERTRNTLSKNVTALRDADVVRRSQAFFRIMTSGDFGVHNRTADVERASAVQHAATAYISAIRTARMRDHLG